MVLNRVLKMKETASLAIIGCGLTGTAMLYQFIRMNQRQREKGQRPKQAIRILVFEQTQSLGPGLPYGRDQVFPFHITNMRAGDMSIDAQCPEDFTHWVSARETHLKMQYPELCEWFSEAGTDPSLKDFPPRMVMGEYLKDRFKTAVQLAQEQEVTLMIRKGWEVIDIQDQGSHLSLFALNRETRDLESFPTEKALLATGYWFDRPMGPGHFPSPWPAGALTAQIPQGERVAVIGTSLSAIDATLTLLSDGRFMRQENGSLRYLPAANSRRVALFSRKGLLPKVRGPMGNRQNRFFSKSGVAELRAQKKGRLDLDDIFGLLRQELESAYGRPMDWEAVLRPQKDPASILREDIRQAKNGDTPRGDILWQTLLFQSTEILKNLYIESSPEQRQKFDDYKSVFMAHAAPIPLMNAEKMLALLESGLLTIHRLQGPHRSVGSPDKPGFEFQYQDQYNRILSRTFRFVVDARGQSLSYDHNPSPLAKHLPASGLVRLENKGILIDPESFRVMTGTGEGESFASPRLFCVGIMNQGQIINASMARECALSTHKIALGVIQDLYETQA
jgi:uncharacterized NAD(P)/FAD-binding protein YdhS